MYFLFQYDLKGHTEICTTSKIIETLVISKWELNKLHCWKLDKNFKSHSLPDGKGPPVRGTGVHLLTLYALDIISIRLYYWLIILYFLISVGIT